MRFKYLIFTICYIFISDFLNISCLEAVSSNVPPESLYYEKLEKLQAFGLVDGYISGIMPLSREEFARQIKEAIKNREKTKDLKNPLVDRILDEFKKEFKEELSGQEKVRIRIFDETSKEIVELSENSTPHLETNALNKPLVSERAGENPAEGLNFIASVNGFVDFPKFASFYIEPRLIFRQNDDGFDLDFAKGYLKFGHKNIELELGRDAQMWGYGFSGKMQLGNNIKGLTMAKISNPRPVYLPWIFKYLGRIKFVMLFSMLENEREHSYPHFWATMIMFKPCRYVEWGVGRTTMLAGEGTDPLNAWEYLAEAILGVRAYDIRQKNSGNSSISFHALVNLPFLRYTQLFFDGYFEDLGLANIYKYKYQFTRDLAFNTGIKIPRIDREGNFSAKTEFVKTTQITYRNGVYTDGYTYAKNIIGHHIGPDAFGNYTRFTYMPSSRLKFDLDFHYEKHGRTGLDQNSNPLDPAIFEKPEERHGFILSLSKNFMERFSADISFGYERIENYDFQDGEGRNNAIGGASLRYKF